MEPMTLGSPVGSPTTAPSSPTSPFLPAYLMGDNAPSASTPRSSMQTRQQTPKTVTFASTGLAMPSSINANVPASIGSGRALQSVTSPPEKPTSDFGPPVFGLFDTLSPLPGAGISSHHNSTFPSTSGLFSPSVFTQNPGLFASPLPSVSTTSQGNPITPGPDTLFGSESQKLPETHRNKESPGREGRLGTPKEGEQNTWVTVFGFMPSAVNDILAHFVHCGTILEHRWGTQAEGNNSAQRCNWVHLHFRTMREARRALAKNGKIFGGCMMIGVVPCQDPEILRSQKENIQGPEVNFPAKPKNSSGVISGIRPLGLDFVSPTRESAKARSIGSPGGERTGIRPLMKSNSLPDNEMQSGGSAKNHGLISRTIDFFLGQ